MSGKRTPGLFKRNKIWWIIKTIHGIKVRKSTKCETLEDAEKVLSKRIEEIRKAELFGERPQRTFNEAALRYLEESTHARQDIVVSNFNKLIPFFGGFPLNKINMGTLQEFIEHEKKRGLKNRSINIALQTVRNMLNLASSEWIDGCGLTWLEYSPKIKLLPEKDSRKPYPISWDEQRRLFPELPDHLRLMAIFLVNTGCRENEVCFLKWEYEMKIPELGASIFVIPGEFVKNREDRVVYLNHTARNVIEKVRGVHHEYVFTYKGHPIQRLNGKAWRKARSRADLNQVRVHDLKHTWGARLRLAGVPEEDRSELTGHKSGKSMTTYYSAPHAGKMIEYADRVKETDSGPSLMVVGGSLK